MLLQSNTSTRNIIKQSTFSPDTDFSNVTRLFILLKSTFQYMQYPEPQVFKFLSFADICTALLLHINTEMHIPKLELLTL